MSLTDKLKKAWEFYKDNLTEEGHKKMAYNMEFDFGMINLTILGMGLEMAQNNSNTDPGAYEQLLNSYRGGLDGLKKKMEHPYFKDTPDQRRMYNNLEGLYEQYKKGFVSDDDYTLLGLDKDNCTDEDVKKVFRRDVKPKHPDQGGDADEFDKYFKAYNRIKKSRDIK